MENQANHRQYRIMPNKRIGPHHTACNVFDRSSDKPVWTTIGATFENRGDSFTLALEPCARPPKTSILRWCGFCPSSKTR